MGDSNTKIGVGIALVRLAGDLLDVKKQPSHNNVALKATTGNAIPPLLC